MNKRNKLITKIAIIFVLALMICTFLSRSISNYLVPKVEIAQSKSGSLNNSYYGNGVVSYLDCDNIFSKGMWRIKEVNGETNKLIEKGMVLATIDTEEIEIEEKKKNLEIKALENEISAQKSAGADSKIISLKEDALEIAKAEYKMIRNGLSDKGEIIATVSGSISEVNVMNGQLVQPNTLLFKLAERDSGYCINWETDSVDGKEFFLDMNVNANIQSERQVVKFTSNIVKKEYIKEEGKYKFSSTLDKDEVTRNVIEVGDRGAISFEKFGTVYEKVVPKQCIVQSPTGGNVVYVVKERDGIFGVERYVEEAKVEIIESDNLNSAVKDLPSGIIGIVQDTTKILADGMKVRVSEVNE